uniref:Pre-mRNA-splicing factor 18 n=1 Tax=Araucaria cunninghamii TaxID=56994 RepID=A0A0D6QV10_ARACU
MDFLKKELERKRKRLESDFGGRKFVKRSEIEQREIERIREEERKEEELRVQTNKPSSDGNSLPDSQIPSSAATKTSAKSKEDITEEQKLDDLVLPRAEVIRRLRFLKQPITLFGEDDDARLERLKSLLKAGIMEPDSDMTEGQQNDFLRDLAELKKHQKTGISQRKKEKDKDGMEDGEGNAGSDDNGGGGGSSGVDMDKDLKRLKSNFDDLCDEDKILVFFKRLLNEWEQELEDRPEAEKRTGRGKSMVATFKQCARYLKPLFKFCRKKCLPDDIRQALLVVVECCMKRDYLAAMDQYIKLAIGNAPWPIGVTMVGIHERSAREKIYTNSVAHIMNDETTRKYLQSIKRLMTLCQRRYPSLPSKSVEFNSLANGSDLQSLLSEEKQKTGSHNAEERLRLMAGPAEDGPA